MKRYLDRGTTTPLVVEVFRSGPKKWWTVDEVHERIAKNREDYYGQIPTRKCVADSIWRLTLSAGEELPPFLAVKRIEEPKKRPVIQYRLDQNE